MSGLFTLSLRLIPKCPAKEAHFCRLYPQSHSFGHYPKHYPERRSGQIDCPSHNFAFRLSSFCTTTKQHSARVTADAAPIYRSVSHSLLPALVNNTTKYVRFLLIALEHFSNNNQNLQNKKCHSHTIMALLHSRMSFLIGLHK